MQHSTESLQRAELVLEDAQPLPRRGVGDAGVGAQALQVQQLADAARGPVTVTTG